MDFPTVLGHVASLVLLTYLWGYAFVNRGRPGSKSLLSLFSLLLVWATAAFLEPWVPLDAKIWLRNTATAMSYCAPAALWSFVRSYTGKMAHQGNRSSWGVWALTFWGIFMTVLLFTDGWHHWLRAEVTQVVVDGRPGLQTKSTAFSSVLIAFNYLAIGISLVPLVVFTLRNGRAVRMVLVLFVLAIVVTAGYALFRQFGGGVAIPISWLFTVSGLLLALGAYRYDFLRVTPIARDVAFDVLEEGIVVSSADGRVIDLNAAARSFLLPQGGTFDEAAAVLDLAVPERREACSGGQIGQYEFALERDGVVRSLQMTTYPVTTGSRAALGCVSVLRDVTVLRQQNAVLVEKAERDGLTGLFNRATFVDRVERRLAPGGETPVLLVFDIDDFKGINDHYGHLSGDEVLRGVCDRVRTDLREGDVFGRLGGDEFAVFLMGLDAGKVAALAERIRADVASLTLLPIPVTLSIGYVVQPARTFAELYHAADQALYQAKRGGKNRVSGGLRVQEA